MRPLKFAPDDVVRVATYLFWEKGYAGTSMDEVMTAAHVNKQSLYNHFGDKKSLFLKALHFYFEDTMAVVREILSQKKPVPDLLQQMFQYFMDRSAAGPYPPGCLVVNTMSEFGQSDHDITAALDGMAEEFEQTLKKTILAGQKEQTITDTMKAADAAIFLKGILCGVQVLIRKGDRSQKIRRITDLTVLSICR